jgi:hypothetical protein
VRVGRVRVDGVSHARAQLSRSGDDLSHVFSIKIASTESVFTLKETIRNKKSITFHHVEADVIKLWKVRNYYCSSSLP